MEFFFPQEHEAGGQRIEESVKLALKTAHEMGIQGKDTTPFLLSEVNRLTGGTSLVANKALVENNVRVATKISIILAKLRKTAGTLSDGKAGGKSL